MSEAARKLKLSAILTLLLALAPIATAQQQRNAVLPPATITNIEEAVTAFMAKINAPGLSLAIGVEGQLRFDNGYGLANLENFVPGQSIDRLPACFTVEANHGGCHDAARRAPPAGPG